MSTETFHVDFPVLLNLQIKIYQSIQDLTIDVVLQKF